ncbi:hypothetical protein V5799_033775 [Amblyomma americanum]|uniref:Uncharacterized protein n=1 Tax=Amblyomma americanum TaxID=6943 RepID=A0AAQ4DMC5_AMBAM
MTTRKFSEYFCGPVLQVVHHVASWVPSEEAVPSPAVPGSQPQHRTLGLGSMFPWEAKDGLNHLAHLPLPAP